MMPYEGAGPLLVALLTFGAGCGVVGLFIGYVFMPGAVRRARDTRAKIGHRIRLRREYGVWR